MEYKFEWADADFYRVPKLFAKPRMIKADLQELVNVELIDLALQKWNFILNTLIKSRLQIDNGVMDEDDWHIDQGGNETCALCRVYLHGGGDVYTCSKCPIFEFSGGQGCSNTPYIEFCDATSVAGAIHAASLAVEYLEDLKERMLNELA